MSKKIPTEVARNIATKYEWDRVVIFAFTSEEEKRSKQTVTYGINKKNSLAAADFGENINKIIEGKAKIVSINKWR